MRDIIFPWSLFENTFPFTIAFPHPIPFLNCLPLPLPFPLPVLSHLPFPLAIICSLSLPGVILTALHVFLTLTVVVVIPIPRVAPPTTRRSGICPVLIIIVISYLILIQRSDSWEIALLLLLAALQLDLCAEIIATIPRETLAGAFNLPRAGCLRIGAIDSILKRMGVVPTPFIHLVAGFVKQFAPYMRGRLPTTPEKANSCCHGAATSAGIVTSGQS